MVKHWPMACSGQYTIKNRSRGGATWAKVGVPLGGVASETTDFQGQDQAQYFRDEGSHSPLQLETELQTEKTS